MRQILSVHVAVANGNLDARAPMTRGSLLFPLCAGLNTTLSRFADDAYTRRRARSQAKQLVAAIEALGRGEAPGWPEPTADTEIDRIIFALRAFVDAHPQTPQPRV